MTWLRSTGAFVAVCFASMAMAANVINPNRHGQMENIGPDSATFWHAGETMDGFAVRLTDPHGNPLPGIEVDFFPNVTSSGNEPPPGSPPDPPAEMYGHFDRSSGNHITDADGIARSGTFTAGTVAGKYQVTAAVWVSFYSQNHAVFIAPPGPLAFFDINQAWVGPLDALPALSLPSLLGLAGMLVGLVWWKRRAMARF